MLSFWTTLLDLSVKVGHGSAFELTFDLILR